MPSIKITDDMICQAAGHWEVEHADAPTELELHRLRKSLETINCGDIQMLSLHWLRNRFVQLRKKHGLRTLKPQKTMEMF